MWLNNNFKNKGGLIENVSLHAMFLSDFFMLGH